MALIKCPECGKSISDKAEKCPHCGIPAEYFPKNGQNVENNSESIDYEKLPNILISFDNDYVWLFSADHYITNRETKHFLHTYNEYYSALQNKLIFQYVCNNATVFRVDTDSLKLFLRRMNKLK